MPLQPSLKKMKTDTCPTITIYEKTPSTKATGRIDLIDGSDWRKHLTSYERERFHAVVRKQTPEVTAFCLFLYAGSAKP